jgi:FeS assembly SUF system protein
MSEENKVDTFELETKIVATLKNIFDPEIPQVNIYDLGLIYEIDVKEDGSVLLRMTLTAPNCPIADQILNEVKQRVEAIPGVKELDLVLTFDPPWDKSMMSEEALLMLGML